MGLLHAKVDRPNVRNDSFAITALAMMSRSMINSIQIYTSWRKKSSVYSAGIRESLQIIRSRVNVCPNNLLV